LSEGGIRIFKYYSIRLLRKFTAYDLNNDTNVETEVVIQEINNKQANRKMIRKRKRKEHPNNNGRNAT
jgi:hypothetical protein